MVSGDSIHFWYTASRGRYNLPVHTGPSRSDTQYLSGYSKIVFHLLVQHSKMGVNIKTDTYGYDSLFTDVQPWVDVSNEAPITEQYFLSAVTAPIYYANPTSVG